MREVYAGKLSADREKELRNHLRTRLLTKMQPGTIDKTVQMMNDIREEKISIHDWFPGLEGVAKYWDLIETWGIEEFLIL